MQGSPVIPQNLLEGPDGRPLPYSLTVDSIGNMEPLTYEYLSDCEDGFCQDLENCDCHDHLQQHRNKTNDRGVEVRVKAQVMTRDDSTGGWVPMGGGGMSLIGLRRIDRVLAAGIGIEYLIVGQRIADRAVVLNCPIRRDFQYTKANPTFHHWQTGCQKFGLTFQSSADAFSFERSIIKAAESIQENDKLGGFKISEDEDRMMSDLKQKCSKIKQMQKITIKLIECVLMFEHILRLRFSRGGGGLEGLKGSVSQSTSLATLSSPARCFHQGCGKDSCRRATGLSADSIHRPTRGLPMVPRTSGRGFNPLLNHKIDSVESEPSHDMSEEDNDINRKLELYDDVIQMSEDVPCIDNSYVHFSKTQAEVLPPVSHDYCYPTLQSAQQCSRFPARGPSTRAGGSEPRPVMVSPKRTSDYSQVTPQRQRIDVTSESGQIELSMLQALPSGESQNSKCAKYTAREGKRKVAYGQRAVCAYCFEVFVEGVTEEGCPDAPNHVISCIEAVSCTCAAHAALYHCASDPEGDYTLSCHCSSKKECRKWALLAILSLFLPCLWFYYPLIGCHKCARKCGFCISRHKAV